MPLTDAACRAAKPDQKPRKMADGYGLYLLVQPNGSRLWRMNYRHAGKQKTLAFGKYPDVGLAEARGKAGLARTALTEGRDPGLPPEASGVTFESIGREWWRNNLANWVPKYQTIVMRRLEADVFPQIGDRAITSIEAPDLLIVLRKVEERGAVETARRLRAFCSDIFAYAISTGRASRDPASDMRKAMQAAPRVKHMARLSEGDLPGFLAKLAKYDGEEQTALAIELVARTFVRTNEIRFGKWDEIDGDLWRIPGTRMKAGREHLVPLVPQTSRILDRLREIADGSEWIVPGVRRDKPISENTMIYAMYRAGYHRRATIHGLRGTASTILNESLLWNPDAIERQLAHVPGNAVRAAYNAAQYLPERRRMMQWWSDYLDRKRELADLLG